MFIFPNETKFRSLGDIKPGHLVSLQGPSDEGQYAIVTLHPEGGHQLLALSTMRRTVIIREDKPVIDLGRLAFMFDPTSASLAEKAVGLGTLVFDNGIWCIFSRSDGNVGDGSLLPLDGSEMRDGSDAASRPCFTDWTAGTMRGDEFLVAHAFRSASN